MRIYLEIDAMPSQATLDEIKQLLDQSASAATPFFVELTKAEKEGIRTVAEGREGYVRIVTDLSETYSNELPKVFDETVLRQKLNLREIIGLLLLKSQKITTMLDNTYVGLGADIMQRVDETVSHLNASRTRNGELDKAMNAVDEYNKRFGKKKDTPPPLTTTDNDTPTEN